MELKTNITKPSGRIKIKTYRSTPLTRALPSAILREINKYRKPIRETEWDTNLVMNGTNTGIQLLAQALAGEISSIAITSAKIGNDNTAPANGDTDIIGATNTQIGLTYVSRASAVSTFEFFFSDADLANATYHEFAMFIGTNIFSRVLINQPNGYVKASNEDTQVTYQITFTN